MRYESADQLDLVKKAAKRKHWSVNRFLIEVSLEASKSVMANGVGEQLMGNKDPLPLNQ